MLKKMALVGCGRIGQRHAEQISKLAHLAAVCDIRPERADKLASEYAAIAHYSLEDLLKNADEIELIAICTPNGLHARHAIQALESGINVLCEKPLCIHSEDGKRMVAAAAKANKKLFVVKQNRYNPPVVFLKQLISENKLGRIFSFEINCFWNRPADYYNDWKGKLKIDGGTLFTQFSHFIELLYCLLGDVKNINAIIKNLNHPDIEFEDTGVVLFEMENNIIGSLNYTVNSFEKNMEGSFTVFAEKGTVKIGGQYLNELEYFNVEGVVHPQLPKGNSANSYGFYQGSMSNHDKVYGHLIKALDDDSYNFASAEEGLKTVEIIEKIYNASR